MVGPVIDVGPRMSGQYRVDWSPVIQDRALAQQGLKDIFGGIKSFEEGRRDRQTLDQLAQPNLDPLAAMGLARGIYDPKKRRDAMQTLKFAMDRQKPRPKLRMFYKDGESRAVGEASDEAYRLADEGWSTDKPPAPEKDPTSFREWERAKQGGYTGSYADWKTLSTVTQGTPSHAPGAFHPNYGDVAKRVGPGYVWDYDPATKSYRTDERGFPKAVPLTGGKAEGYSAEQAKAASWADRMSDAERILGTPLGEGGPNLDEQGLEFMQAALTGGTRLPRWIPGIDAADIAIEGLRTDAYLRYAQAKEGFISALLRKETGAEVKDSEFYKYDKQFFPQPGDTPATIAQKREARQREIESMARAAGPRYREEMEKRRKESGPPQPPKPIPKPESNRPPFVERVLDLAFGREPEPDAGTASAGLPDLKVTEAPPRSTGNPVLDSALARANGRRRPAAKPAPETPPGDRVPTDGLQNAGMFRPSIMEAGGGAQVGAAGLGLPDLNPTAAPAGEGQGPTMDPAFMRFMDGVGTVSGSEPETETISATGQAGLPVGYDPAIGPEVGGASAGAARFKTMDLAGLKAAAANAATMSDEEYDAYLARLNEIAGG